MPSSVPGAAGRNSLVAAASALAMLWPVGQALALQPAAAVGDTAEQHCVTRLETAETACFDAFSTAVSVATNGLVELSAGARPDITSAAFRHQVTVAGRELTQRQADGRLESLALAAVWLSVEYAQPNYAGSSWITTAGSPCDDSPDYDHATASLAGSGWDDAVSSFVGFNHCQVEHWTGYSFSGAVNYGSQDPVFPWQVDNQTSSLRFY